MGGEEWTVRSGATTGARFVIDVVCKDMRERAERCRCSQEEEVFDPCSASCWTYVEVHLRIHLLPSFYFSTP